MKKYFIKAPISGWHEVTKGAYEEHCERVRKGSPAIPEHRKAAFIATRTKEVELGEYYYTAKKYINKLLYNGEYGCREDAGIDDWGDGEDWGL